jgi:hypothetical protein
MSIHLNKFTKSHLCKTVENLHLFYNVPTVHSATKEAVIDIYKAFNELLKVIHIDKKWHDYLKTKSGAKELNEEGILTEIEDVKNQMSAWEGDKWSADYPLRCLLIGLQEGRIKYPDDERGLIKKLCGIGELSEFERLNYEEKLLEPVAQYLTKIVLNYYDQTPS